MGTLCGFGTRPFYSFLLGIFSCGKQRECADMLHPRSTGHYMHFCPLGSERVYLPLYEVADVSFHIQSNKIFRRKSVRV